MFTLIHFSAGGTCLQRYIEREELDMDTYHNSLVFQAETYLPTEFGNFRFRVYKNKDGEEVIAIATRDLERKQHVPVRVHSSCFTAEVMSSLKCDCRQQLDYALSYIAEHGGVVIYLPQEGRGIGLSNKIRAYALQEDGHDTIEANHLLGLPIDGRQYDDAAAILRDLNIESLQLITNNPDKLKAMSDLGFSVHERIPVPIKSNLHSHGYLEVKRSRMGHMLNTSEKNHNNLHPLISKTRIGTKNRPFVHVNFAISKNGSMEGDTEYLSNISCEKDWQRVHELRERYSAVAVGAKTWIRDSPQLTARQERLGRSPQRQPDRVIFSGQNKCSIVPNSQRSFTIGLTKPNCRDNVHISASSRSLSAPLETLFEYGVDTLLVEGGMTLIESFISQNMADRITIYVATSSLDDAINVITEHFLDMPISVMDAVPLGSGTLLSYSAHSIYDKKNQDANLSSFYKSVSV